MTEEITEAIRNVFNEYLNAVDKIILENQALQIELQHLKEKCFAVEQESIQKSQTICDLKQENEELKTTIYKLESKTDTMCECNKEMNEDLKLFRSALEEIKEMLGYGYIVDKINEVL